MISYIRHLQGKIWGKRVLHAEGPVPNVRRSEVAGHAHDGAWSGVYRVAVEPGRTDIGAEDRHSAVPLRKDGRNRKVPSCDRAACSVSCGVDRGCRRNVAQAKGVVEG